MNKKANSNAMRQAPCVSPAAIDLFHTASLRIGVFFHGLRYHIGAVFTCLLLGAWVPMAIGQTSVQEDAQTKVARLRMTDFFQFPVGPKGLQISPALREAQGKRVSLQGFVVQQEVAAPGQFLLTPRPVQMSQHADGEADDLPPSTVLVSLPADQKDWMVAYTSGLVEVVGMLDVGRQEGSDGRVSWVRLQLDSEATRRMNAVEFLSYRHAQQHKH
jgi:hypothetical protein